MCLETEAPAEERLKPDFMELGKTVAVKQSFLNFPSWLLWLFYLLTVIVVSHSGLRAF